MLQNICDKSKRWKTLTEMWPGGKQMNGRPIAMMEDDDERVFIFNGSNFVCYFFYMFCNGGMCFVVECVFVTMWI